MKSFANGQRTQLQPNLDLTDSDLRRDDQHRYWKGELRKPGASQILKAVNFIQGSPFWTDAGREKGTDSHSEFAKILMGTFDWANVNEDVMDEANTFEEWVKENGFQAILVETMLYSEIYGFAGTIDAFGAFPDGTYQLPDWKRGAASPSEKYKLALYVQLVCENSERLFGKKIHPFMVNRFALTEIGSGKPKPVPYKNKNDRDIALGLVAAFHAGVNDGIFSLEA